jgi:lysophospholipase L1-like esterase
MSMTLCKWLLIGDSLVVGFRSLPDQINRAEIGRNLAGVEKTIDKDLKFCPKGTVLISVGSNDMWRFKKSIHASHNKKYVQRFNALIEKIKKTRKVLILPVPAGGRHKEAADKINYHWSFYSEFIPLHPNLRQHLTFDNVHLKRDGHKIWLEQINARTCGK